MRNSLSARDRVLLEAQLFTRSLLIRRTIQLGIVIALLSIPTIHIADNLVSISSFVFLGLCVSALVACVSVWIATFYSFLTGESLIIDENGIIANGLRWSWEEIQELALDVRGNPPELHIAVRLKSSKQRSPRMLVADGTLQGVSLERLRSEIGKRCRLQDYITV